MIVLGNWKMNGNRDLLKGFNSYNKGLLSNSLEGVFPGLLLPYPYLGLAGDLIPGIKVGAQDVYPEDEGAITGAVSGVMLKELGCHWVCVGHSERRKIFHEESEWVAKKCFYVASHGMTPVLCVGEDAVARSQGRAREVVLEQLKPVFQSNKPPEDLIIAYEPVWAIGQGRSASMEEIEDMHQCISDYTNNYLAKGASVPIIYGGSVNPENAKSIMKVSGVDGFLIGGVSLSPELFCKVVDLCSSYCSSSM
ncbi:MAG TPA: triose-phosphate isomerase [Gammaproteobacteria bacterium]|nr:triose-phosphate isomerase [Gammaproteobacteria bacterium]